MARLRKYLFLFVLECNQGVQRKPGPCDSLTCKRPIYELEWARDRQTCECQPRQRLIATEDCCRSTSTVQISSCYLELTKLFLFALICIQAAYPQPQQSRFALDRATFSSKHNLSSMKRSGVASKPNKSSAIVPVSFYHFEIFCTQLRLKCIKHICIMHQFRVMTSNQSGPVANSSILGRYFQMDEIWLADDRKYQGNCSTRQHLKWSILLSLLMGNEVEKQFWLKSIVRYQKGLFLYIRQFTHGLSTSHIKKSLHHIFSAYYFFQFTC